MALEGKCIRRKERKEEIIDVKETIEEKRGRGVKLRQGKARRMAIEGECVRRKERKEERIDGNQGDSTRKKREGK